MTEYCNFCGGKGVSETLTVREMMLGLPGIFDYKKCAQCASLRIDNIPDNISQYYGEGYYSFAHNRVGFFRHFFRTLRDAGHFGRGGKIGRALAERNPDIRLKSLARAGINRDMRILDVGCGQGALLDRLASIGFRHLLGVDPYVSNSFETRWGATITKRFFEDVTDVQDVIMFHHSLEHVPDPEATLRWAHNILTPSGVCFIRIPTPSSEAFDRYGANWIQLDAPRHIALPSRDGMIQLAERVGFNVVETFDDGWGFGFWGSELYRRGIPLNLGGKGEVNPCDHFESAELARWERDAAEANANSRGDQVAFVLHKRGN